MKKLLKKIPGVKQLIRSLTRRTPFTTSQDYWSKRYSAGGDSGSGSYGKFAQFKAEFINAFIKEHQISDVIEFGCGDGNQLRFAEYPQYLGVDVSETAIGMCKNAYGKDETKRFQTVEEYGGEQAELSMSLDVIYHLVEDSVFDCNEDAFAAGKKYVIVYSSDTNEAISPAVDHVRHRKFSDWISEHRSDWKLLSHTQGPFPFDGNYEESTWADFFVYARES